MTIFDTYDKIIENIQQIPLDVYLFMRRKRRISKKVDKLNKKYKKLLKLTYKGINVDIKTFNEVSDKLTKKRNKFKESADTLQKILMFIYDKSNQIINLEVPTLQNPKLSIDNINRIVKVGRCRDNGPNYCICKQKASDNMIACDNIKCTVKWFHFECAGITLPPKNVWLCSECRKIKDVK